MKKAFAFMAVIAAVCAVSCKKGDTPASKPVEATITAADVTVEEGKTVNVNATTNSTATISYVQDNSGVYSVDAAGVVTGIKAGEGQLTIKVPAVEGKFTAAEKSIKVTVTGVTPPEPKASLTIDGSFEDWAALKEGTFSKTYGDEDATHPVLTHCKVYADANFIYVYFEYDADAISHEPDVEHVPFHCYINTDGNTATGGFSDQFADACTDLLLEGFIYPDGAEIGSYDPTAYAWEGEPNGSGWGWGEDILPDGGACEGAGIEGKYEFKIDRSVLAGIGFPVADVFSIGFDIQQSWDSVGVLPNAAPSEDNPSGVVNSLTVTTQK